MLLYGYQLELENNTINARTGFYIKNNIKFKRRNDLEGINSNLVIIGIKDTKVPVRLINIYRSFNPQNNVSPREKFKYQLQLIKKAFNVN